MEKASAGPDQACLRLGVQKAKPEYEDIAELARKNGVSLQAVRDAVAKKG